MRSIDIVSINDVNKLINSEVEKKLKWVIEEMDKVRQRVSDLESVLRIYEGGLE